MPRRRRKTIRWGLLLVASLAGIIAVLLPHLLRGGGVADYSGNVFFPLYATAWDRLHPLLTLGLATGLGAVLGMLWRKHWFVTGNAFLLIHLLWLLLNTFFGPERIDLLPPLLIFSYVILALPALTGAFLGSRVRTILSPQRAH
ncbi:hypothetical protein KQI65_17780 [bacterium]|nr:hypothetical protein [bacterium]